MKSIAALYPNRQLANAAIGGLLAQGTDRSNISVISHRGVVTAQEWENKERPNALEGAEAGALGGAVGGALAAIGLAAVPGIGWILAAGPIGAIIASAAVGGAVGAAGGGLSGALNESGLDGDIYAEAVRRGGILVVVAASDAGAEKVRAELWRHRPVDVEQRAKVWRQQGWTQYEQAAPQATQDQIDAEREYYANSTPGNTYGGIRPNL